MSDHPYGSLEAYLAHHLKIDGFDGLYHDSLDCACELSDLMPCCDPGYSCAPGYYQTLTAEQIADGDTFRIGPTKPVTPDQLEDAGQLTLFDAADGRATAPEARPIAVDNAAERVAIGAKP
jgi:hypothetical protein